MRKLILVLFFLLAACSNGVFRVPPAEYQQQVKTLGVLPVLVDARSTIQHPQAAEIVDLLRYAAEGQTLALVEALRKKKGYFDVRQIDSPARLVEDRLLERANFDEMGQPVGYQLNQAVLAELCQDAVVDGLLILNLQGAVHSDKRWSRNTFESLTTDYNDILGSASVVAADGRVLWEMNGSDAFRILPLQYADFDEAYFNRTDNVKLKFISLSGLEKTLLPPALKQGTQPVSPQLSEWLDKVGSALSPSLFR